MKNAGHGASRSWVTMIALVACLALTACGGGGGGGTPPPPTTASTSSGTFIDSVVQGLGYTCLPSGLTGKTDAAGLYQYMPGDTVTFDVGGRVIGTVPASPQATALSVFGATSISDPRVVNLSILLLTLGGIPTGQNPIQLPATIPAGLPNPLDFSNPNFVTQLQTALPGTTIVTPDQATAHLQTSFKTLTVTLVNDGAVTSNPAGINCTAGTCSYDFVTGTSVTLTAIGSGFTGWTGAGCGGTGTCTVTMTANTAVTATFSASPPPATLTILPNQGTGTGTVACSANGGTFGPCAASYANGTALVLQATANSGSTFSGWLDGTGSAPTCNGTTVNCALSLTADSALRANFVLNIVTFSLTANTSSSNGGGGTIACSTTGGAPFGACAASYNAGTSLTLQATPNNASNFTGWGNGSGSGTGSPSACNATTGLCTFTMTANSSITANFNRPTLSVVIVGTGTVNSNPAGINSCTTNCSAVFDKGTQITLTASGGTFTGWTGGGCSGTSTCAVTLNADTAVTANFGAGLPSFAQAALQAYVKASNPEGQDYFGNYIALSGDTLAVGAYQEDSCATGINGIQTNGCTNAGAVYVFTRTAGVWSQQAYLKASNTDAGDRFGHSLSLSGDTLAVGAPEERSCNTSGSQADNGCGGAGAVYVFTRTAGVWTQQAYLKDTADNFSGENFGHSVSLQGDTLAVGALFDDRCGDGSFQGVCINSGSVFVFTRTAGVWTQQAFLKASNAGVNDTFGSSVALDGNTLVVGAYSEDSCVTGINGDANNNSCGHAGAVYVYTQTAGIWTQQAYLKASNTNADDQFGHTIALNGDTLAVAASREASCATGINGDQSNNGCGQAGAVYVFTRTAGTWSQQAYLKASNTGFDDRFGGGQSGTIFGNSVALSGDQLAVGAWEEDSCATGINGNQADNGCGGAGAVYVFTRTGNTWSQEAYVKASNANTADAFGFAVALSGNTLAVGAFGEGSCATGINGNQTPNPNCDGSGAVYVYVKP